MAEAIGLSGDFAPAFASLCACIGGGGDFGASMSLDSGGSFDAGGGGGDGGGAAPAMEP